MRKMLSLMIAFAVFFTGCASHKALQQPTLALDVPAIKNRTVKEGVEAMVKPIHKEEDLKLYFDEDAIRYGVLPIQVYIKNSSDKDYVLKTDGVNLINDKGERIPALSPEKAYERLRKSYWRSGGWAVATGVFAGISVYNVTKVNKKVKKDINSRILKDVGLSAGNVAEGTMFFDVPMEINSLEGWRLDTVLTDNDSGSLLYLPNVLSGEIKVREKPKAEPGEINTAG